ncbi:MAG: YraN family protein [Butyricicoccus sp.]
MRRVKAAGCTEKRGWHTAATNFRTRFGEIDIIAENAQYVIFAEVKTRKTLARSGV